MNNTTATITGCYDKFGGHSLHQPSVIPEPYSRHQLVKDQLFFTIPEPLFTGVLREIGATRFDPELLELEAVLASRCGDHTLRVGFWGCRPIDYILLRREPLKISPNLAAAVGLHQNAAQLALFTETANTRITRLIGVARGYCGWLVLNSVFRREHLELFQTWSDEVKVYGVPHQEFVVEKGKSLPKGWRKTGGRTKGYAQAFEQFFIRWRLADLAAPFLPTPLQPQLPVINLRSVLGHMRHGGSTFYLPDTFPVHSRDELREILEDAAGRQDAPEHLQEWQALIGSGNTSKNALGRYARLFELHHFWRILHQRHAKALHRRAGKLEYVFASFLKTSQDSIHKDLCFLADKLGNQWASEILPIR